MRAFRHIRPLLTTDAAKTIASAIIGARLDCCNSLLYGSSAWNLERLQKVQNQLARVVLQMPWSASATDAWRQLHWLPVTQRIVFKIATVTYHARQSGQLVYLCSELEDYRPTWNSRSPSAPLLNRPHVNDVFSSCAFSVSAPTVWNSLQSRTRLSETYATFRNRLKTELFQKSYNTWHCDAIAVPLIRMRLTAFLGTLQIMY